jgi:hypothetical protein
VLEEEERPDGDEDRREEGDGDRREAGDERGYDDNDIENRNGDEIPMTSQPIKKVFITRASLSSVASRATLSSLNSGTSGSVTLKSCASSVRSHTTVRRQLFVLTLRPCLVTFERYSCKICCFSTYKNPTDIHHIHYTSYIQSFKRNTVQLPLSYSYSSPSSPPPRTRQISGASTISTRTLSVVPINQQTQLHRLMNQREGYRELLLVL